LRTVIFAEPEFDTVTICDRLAPTFTLPKLRLWTAKESEAGGSVFPLTLPTPDWGDWFCEGEALVVGTEVDDVVPALDGASLDAVVDVAESETLKESSAEIDCPSESCKAAMNEKVPGAVGVPVTVLAVGSSARPGGRSPSATLHE